MFEYVRWMLIKSGLMQGKFEKYVCLQPTLGGTKKCYICGVTLICSNKVNASALCLLSFNMYQSKVNGLS